MLKPILEHLILVKDQVSSEIATSPHNASRPRLKVSALHSWSCITVFQVVAFPLFWVPLLLILQNTLVPGSWTSPVFLENLPPGPQLHTIALPSAAPTVTLQYR